MESFILVAFLLFSPGILCGEVEDRCPRNLPHTDHMVIRNEYCYQFVRVEKFWDDAANFCWAYGGHLVHIRDSATNSFVTSQLSSLSWRNSGVWIGLHDRNQEMNWEWVAARRLGRELPLEWSNWDRGHPGAFMGSRRDCVRMVRDDGWKWHETPCHFLRWHYRFICTYPVAPTTPVPTPAIHGGHGGLKGGAITTTPTTTPPTTPPSPSSTTPTTTPMTPSTSSKQVTTVPTKTSTVTSKARATKLLNQNKLEMKEDHDDKKIPEAMANTSETKKSSQGMVMIIVGVGLAAVVIIVIVSVIIGRRRMLRRKTPANIELEYPPKFDNPLYSEADTGVAQALLCNIQTNDSTENCCIDAVKQGDNLYVSPEDMLGTGVKVCESAEKCETQPSKCEALPMKCESSTTKCETVNDDYLMPVSERPLPSRPCSGVGYLPMDGNGKCQGSEMPFVYDKPKAPNEYAEIPGGDRDGNLYESLEEATKPSLFTL